MIAELLAKIPLLASIFSTSGMKLGNCKVSVQEEQRFCSPGRNNEQKALRQLIWLLNMLGVSNGPIHLKSACKIWSLLELLAKITRVLACLCSQNFCKCSHARVLIKTCLIARIFVNPAL